MSIILLPQMTQVIVLTNLIREFYKTFIINLVESNFKINEFGLKNFLKFRKETLHMESDLAETLKNQNLNKVDFNLFDKKSNMNPSKINFIELCILFYVI